MREVVGSSPDGVNYFFFVLGTFSVHLFSHCKVNGGNFVKSLRFCL